jgi:hypothetical protein
VVEHAFAHRRTATIDRYPSIEWLTNSSIPARFVRGTGRDESRPYAMANSFLIVHHGRAVAEHGRVDRRMAPVDREPPTERPTNSSNFVIAARYRQPVSVRK